MSNNNRKLPLFTKNICPSSGIIVFTLRNKTVNNFNILFKKKLIAEPLLYFISKVIENSCCISIDFPDQNSIF